MKKVTNFVASAFIAAAIFTGINASAQTSEKEPAGDSKALRLGVGLNVGLPIETLYSFAIGGDLRLQKDFGSNVSGMLTAGYTNFSIKDKYKVAGLEKSIGFIPVKVGLKVFPLERLYISGEVGAGFGTDNNQETSFIYAPGIGVGFNNGLDLGIRYEGVGKGLSQGFGYAGDNNLNQVALRIAYGFNLSK